MIKTPNRYETLSKFTPKRLQLLKNGGFEPDDIYPYAVESVHFITGKLAQMCSCFLVALFSNSLQQMNFGSIQIPNDLILRASFWD